MQLGDVVNEFHDHDGFTHASAAERTDLAAFQKGTDEINDLDTRGEDLGRGRLIHECRRLAMDWVVLVGRDRPAFIDGIAAHVKYSPHYSFPYQHGYGCAIVDRFVTALEPFSAGHRERPDPPATQVL